MNDFQTDMAMIQRLGYTKKNWRGGYKVTLRGTQYLRDACMRHEDVRAEMSKQADVWAEGGMTKTERREALVALVLLAWSTDRAGEAEARANLAAQGYDPLSPENRVVMEEKFGLRFDDLDEQEQQEH